ncbi:hypothetical protein BH11GEM2_BH11GEM2_22390 [soil metagenome]
MPASVTSAPGADAVRLIDVLWLDRTTGRVQGAFEVEHTTSIYSGIVRLLDLALGGGGPEGLGCDGLFLVAPDDREQDVREHLARPASSRVADLRLRYLPDGELARHRETMARFGHGMKPIEAIARTLKRWSVRLTKENGNRYRPTCGQGAPLACAWKPRQNI